MKRMPLRYNITSWDQLPQCLSNNSRNLKIDVSHFFNNDLLCGLRISVVHRAYGVLFSCMLGASGDLMTSSNYYDDVEEPRAFELTPKQILDELYKFGFCIYYEQREHLSPGQIDYLITLKGLHYDKIRVLGVKGVKNGTDVFSTKVVAFNSENHSQWLDNTYRASEKEFLKGLVDGTAINLTEISETEKYCWTWLDFVANIDDILRDNPQPNPPGDDDEQSDWS